MSIRDLLKDRLNDLVSDPVPSDPRTDLYISNTAPKSLSYPSINIEPSIEFPDRVGIRDNITNILPAGVNKYYEAASRYVGYIPGITNILGLVSDLYDYRFTAALSTIKGVFNAYEKTVSKLNDVLGDYKKITQFKNQSWQDIVTGSVQLAGKYLFNTGNRAMDMNIYSYSIYQSSLRNIGKNLIKSINPFSKNNYEKSGPEAGNQIKVPFNNIYSGLAQVGGVLLLEHSIKRITNSITDSYNNSWKYLIPKGTDGESVSGVSKSSWFKNFLIESLAPNLKFSIEATIGTVVHSSVYKPEVVTPLAKIVLPPNQSHNVPTSSKYTDPYQGRGKSTIVDTSLANGDIDYKVINLTLSDYINKYSNIVNFSDSRSIDFENSGNESNGLKYLSTYRRISKFFNDVHTELHIKGGLANDALWAVKIELYKGWSKKLPNLPYLYKHGYWPITSIDFPISHLKAKSISLPWFEFEIPELVSRATDLKFTVLDTQDHVLKHFLIQYMQSIYNLKEGTVIPYRNACFDITVWKYNQQLEVVSQFRYAAVLSNYTLSFEGNGDKSSGNEYDLQFSIVGEDKEFNKIPPITGDGKTRQFLYHA